MTEYWPTYAGRIQIVQDCMMNGESAIEIVDALDYYAAQFIYRCKGYDCPQRRKTVVAKHAWAGFASREALETHRERDHANHNLYGVHNAVTGYPWYECQCGHQDGPNEDEDWDIEEPQARREHLERVAQYHE